MAKSTRNFTYSMPWAIGILAKDTVYWNLAVIASIWLFSATVKSLASKPRTYTFSSLSRSVSYPLIYLTIGSYIEYQVTPMFPRVNRCWALFGLAWYGIIMCQSSGRYWPAE